jgi:GGDEF domain-containing protein
VLLLSAGLLLLGVTAAMSYVRRVENAEVVAILLFIPIFLAFAFWDWIGGAAMAAVAIGAYIAVRLPAIHAVGFSQFSGVIVSRSLAFAAFGIIGGMANRQVRASLLKLDLYDEVDDITGLNNARSFLQTIDFEMSRARRYQSFFSVSVVKVPVATFAGASRRHRHRALREIGMGLRSSVRTVDKVAYGHDVSYHVFAVVLPETGADGAAIFTERLSTRLEALLLTDGIESQTMTFPGDDLALQRIRNEFVDIDRMEHPEHRAPFGKDIITAA